MNAEELFLKFRNTGDPACLGAVFDLCADDLFAVAMHLCRDRQAAEDAVQSTFLTAIERAPRYASGRALRPWLLGILYRELKRARRRARRVPDASRMQQIDPPPPSQLVLAGEAAAAVRTALANVPQPYREVVELHLVEALPSGGIAERLQRSPGAVRTQLWRGLELLRKLLPKGLALGAAIEIGTRPALAAVRDRVVTAAKAKGAAAGIGATVLVGGLLMKKVLLAVVAMVAVGLLGWQVLPWRDVQPRGAVAVRDSTASAAATDALPRRSVELVEAPQQRTSVEAGTDATPVDPAAAGTPVPARIAVQVLVADGNGKPVPDADVMVYAADAKRYEQRASNEVLQRAVSDALGRCSVEIAGSSLLSARKPGIGWSGDLIINPWRVARQSEWYVVLLPTTTVRGTVLQPDGRPAVLALITGHCPTWYPDQGDTLPTMHSDEHGQFRCEGIAGRDYSFLASLDGRYARGSTPEGKPGEVLELTLQFPGAFSVKGTLLDVEGKPLAGAVWLIAADGSQCEQGKCDAQGRFEILRTAGGAFDLVGGIDGQTSAHEVLVLDEARPKQEITLRTQPFVPVSGKVVDDRGEACAGTQVGLSYVGELDLVQAKRRDLQGLPRGLTAEDGTFHFLAPAGERYRVVVQALPDNRHLWVKGPVFAAPAQDLTLTVREADRQGFVLSGQVVADDDGAVIPRVSVTMTTHRAMSASNTALGSGENGRFEVGPVPTGARCSFEFEAEGFARALVGPFETTVRHEVVTVRLRRCGKVRLRVLRADGTPAVKVRANLERTVDDAFGRFWQGETDRDGYIEFDEVVPEPFKVHARAASEEGGKAVGEVVVKPGQTSDVQLVLRQ